MTTRPAFFRPFELLLMGVELLLVGWLVATEDLAPIGLLVMVVLGTLVLVLLMTRDWPLGAISVLVISSAMPHFKETVFGLHVRPEHLAIGLVVIAMVVRAARGQFASLPPLKIFDILLIAYIGLTFLSSTVTSPEPLLTLRWAALGVLAITPYFMMRALVRDWQVLYKAVHILLWIGAAESVYAVVCFLCNNLFNTTFGMEIGQYQSIPGTYGTQFEANLLGSYVGCCALMFLAFFLMGPPSRRSAYGWGFAITTLGATISLARSVFLALPVGAGVIVWMAAKRGDFIVRRFLPLVIGSGLLLLVFSPLIIGLIRERFSTIDVSEIAADNTTYSRMVQFAVAIEDIKAHPTFGTGTASIHLFFDPNDYPGGFADADEPGWISNTPLRIVHDTGVVGLLVFLAFVCSLLISLRKAAKSVMGSTAAVIAALVGGLVLYAITFQASEATMLAFTWIHVGLLSATISLLQSDSPKIVANKNA